MRSILARAETLRRGEDEHFFSADFAEGRRLYRSRVTYDAVLCATCVLGVSLSLPRLNGLFRFLCS